MEPKSDMNSMATNPTDEPAVTEPAAASEARLVALLEGMRRREVRALDQLYELSVDRLHALVARICGDPRDTEEVLADTYQYAWERASDFDSTRGGVMAWLSMLAWSRASDRRRRARPMQSIETLHPAGVDAAYMDCEDGVTTDPLEAFVDRHQVRLALARLNAEQRRLILMAFFEGASHGEIATRTGMPLGTVKSHIRRGMAVLREQLAGADADG